MTNNAETKVASSTHVDKFTEKFIQEIQSKGIEHVLYWIQGHMDKFTAAQMEDRIANAMRHFPDLATEESRRLVANAVLFEGVVREVESVNNHSTQLGSTYLRQAQVAVAAQMLNLNGGMGSLREMNQALGQALHELRAAQKNAQPK